MRKSPVKRDSALIAIMLASLIFITAFYTDPSEAEEGKGTRAPLSKNLSPLVPYHGAAREEWTGEACMSMAFDAYMHGYDGPYIMQQDIRNVTKGVIIPSSEIATPEELIRAGTHSASPTNPLKGYEERWFGYGAFHYDWTDYVLDPSPRFETRKGDLTEAINKNFPVLCLMYEDIPPELTPEPPGTPNPNPDPNQEPPVTLEDLAALNIVWRLLVGYDNQVSGGRLTCHDPLVGPGRQFSWSDFDMMWNVTTRGDVGFSNHRIGIVVSPWQIKVRHPKTAQAAEIIDIEVVNITYMAPANMIGENAQNAQAVIEVPPEYTVVSESTAVSLSIDDPGTYDNTVLWKVKAPDRGYEGQNIHFYINATGQVGQPGSRDHIGIMAEFNIETVGFLNHPPRILSTSIDPNVIPDDGSVLPLITCRAEDEDNNLHMVTADLSKVGGGTTQRLYDDGTHGDAAANDRTFSYMITSTISQGTKTIKVTAKDTMNARTHANLTLEVRSAGDFQEPPEITRTGLSPRNVPNDGYTTTLIWAHVQDEENDISHVEVDLTPIGGERAQRMYDDATEGDLVPDDGNYSAMFSVDPLIQLGEYQLRISAYDRMEHETTAYVYLRVVLPPAPPLILEVEADPTSVPNDGKTKCVIRALVDDPNEDVVEVYADLSGVNGNRKSMMLNNGGGEWQLEFTVPDIISSGPVKIEVTAEDSEGLEGSGHVTISVEQSNRPPELVEYTITPLSAASGEIITINANVTDPDGDDLTVEVSLGEFGLTVLALKDDGQDPDQEAGDLSFTGSFPIPETSLPGTYNITILVKDTSGSKSAVTAKLTVLEEADAGDLPIGQEIYLGIPIGLGILLLLVIMVAVAKRKQSGTGSQSPPPQFMRPGPGSPPRGPPTPMR